MTLYSPFLDLIFSFSTLYLNQQPAQVSQHKDSGRVQDLRTYIDYHFSQGESDKRLADGYYSQAALEIQHNTLQAY